MDTPESRRTQAHRVMARYRVFGDESVIGVMLTTGQTLPVKPGTFLQHNSPPVPSVSFQETSFGQVQRVYAVHVLGLVYSYPETERTDDASGA